MITINIFRQGVTDPILSAKPNDTTSALKEAIMGETVLSLSFYLDRKVELNIGDYCGLFGKRYYVHASQVPQVKKDSTYGYEYTLDLLSTQYLLQNAIYLNGFSQPDFALYGTASDFIDLLISNAARTGYAFIKGGVITTGYQNLAFNGEDCLNVLGKLADAFDTEWYVEGFTVHLAKKQRQTPYSFQYGKGKGAYDITRRPADSTSIVTRLYVFGGTKNIPTTYRNSSDRLLLPAVSDPLLIKDLTYTVQNNGNGAQTMTFNWTAPADPGVNAITIAYRLTTGTVTAFTYDTGSPVSPRVITVPAGVYEVGFRSETAGDDPQTPTIIITGSSPYKVLTGTDRPFIEYNTEKYGVIERTLTFDDIYPHRTGKVTSVDATDSFVFIDALIDFNINSQLLPGTAAKVIFNTGQLAGYSFTIRSYDDVSKKITLNKNQDEKTLDIPSDLLRPAIGDEYVLVDIIMPQVYIDKAEAELLTKAQDYLGTYSQPVYAYSIDLDPKYCRQKKIMLSVGDLVWVTDIELQVDRSFRIVSLTKKLDDPYSYQIELGDSVSKDLIPSIQASLTSNANSIAAVSNQVNNSKASEGTFSTLTIESIEMASDVSAMKQLYIDAQGKVWKH